MNPCHGPHGPSVNCDLVIENLDDFTSSLPDCSFCWATPAHTFPAATAA